MNPENQSINPNLPPKFTSTMADKLPIDIITEEILPKLPAKYLLRFKSISKSFKTLISSPNFVDHHLRHSLSSAANRLVIGFSGGGLHSFDLNSPQLPSSPLPLPSDFTPHPNNCIVGSCNGLLLIIGVNRVVNQRCSLLINPIMGFYRFLRVELYVGYGFGFDPVIGDYKFVEIGAGGYTVYSLMNKSLRSFHFFGDEIDRNLFSDIVARRKFAVVVNQCLCHWLVWCAARKKHLIVRLDLSTEKWDIDIPLPNYENPCSVSDSSLHFADLLFEMCRDKKSDVIHLVNFEGYLSVSTLNVKSQGNFDVWAMKVYGVAESWVKLFSVSDEWSVPLCYSKRSTSRVLVRKMSGGRKSRLVWYDVRDKQLEKAEIDRAREVNGLYDACVFTGSLVMVPNGQKICPKE